MVESETVTPQNTAPTDMDALLAWLKEQALEASKHKFGEGCGNTCGYCITCGVDQIPPCEVACAMTGVENFANRVIAKIENSRVNQRIHISEKV